MTPPDARPAAIGGSAVPDRSEPRSVDDEGLPRPPPVHGKLPRWLLRGLVRAESITFMAIAVALVVIAVVVFVRGVHDLVLTLAFVRRLTTCVRASPRCSLARGA